MLPVENNLHVYLTFTLRYFDVSGFLEVVYSRLGGWLPLKKNTRSLPFGRGSRAEGRGSRVNGRGSRVNGRGSRVDNFFTITFERRQIKTSCLLEFPVSV